MEKDWNKVKEYLKEATSIAWDGCHKIYILMDEQEHQKMIEYGYGEDGSILERINELTSSAFALVKAWYDGSCELRFIHAVRSVEVGEDEEDDFTDLIPQEF